MSKIYNICFLGSLIALLTLFSCTPDQIAGLEPDNDIADGTKFKVTLGFNAGDMPVSELRSGGVEGISEVKTMRVLVFDEDQKFLYTTDAVLGGKSTNVPGEDASYLPDGIKGGIDTVRSFQVELVKSSRPRYIHFVADYDWSNFSQDYFLVGTSAGALMTQLQTELKGANGNVATTAFDPMWSMVRVESLDENTLKGKVIKLLRNYAKIEIKIAGENNKIDGYEVTNYCVANSNNKSTVVPFRTINYQYEFPFKVTEPTVPTDAKFLPLPDMDHLIPISQTFNLFESKNDDETRKVCVIIQANKVGGTNNPRYFKIDLASRKDNNSINQYIQVLRNTWYVVNIKGIKSDGYDKLEDALNAPADNNIFASVELKDFSKISDGSYNLTTEPINFVVVKPGTYTFNVDFNGKSRYLRFYPDWESDDPYMGEWSRTPIYPDIPENRKPENSPELDTTRTTFTFNVNQIPEDNIKEYKVEVAGLRYADKTNFFNPEDQGYDALTKTPVLDGVTGATTPITRTVHITLRKPYVFNATLEDDPVSQNDEDLLLSFEVYKSYPNSLIPFEVLIDVTDITPRNTGASSDLMLVDRVVNGERKLLYRYVVSQAEYDKAIADGSNRITIPVKTHDETSTLQGNITLTSELYSDETIYGASKPRENILKMWYYLPDKTWKWMPATAVNDIKFKLYGAEYNDSDIKMITRGTNGEFKLQVFDKDLGTEQLEISAWITRDNPYGYFSYLVKKTMTVNEWLALIGDDASVELIGASVEVKGVIYHNHSKDFWGNYKHTKPLNTTPVLYTMEGNSHDDNIAEVSGYNVSNNGRYVNGYYVYDFEFTIPESTYSSISSWCTGLGFGYNYDDENRFWYYSYDWNKLMSNTWVDWWDY